MFDYDEMATAVINGKASVVKELTQKALESGEMPQDVLNKGLVVGMNVVGIKFKNDEFYVPEVLIAARAMKAAMEVLRPKLAEKGIEPIAKGVIGTVQGDLHDIGKNLVAMMLEGAGFEILDLGEDVRPEVFVNAVKESGAKLVLLSALLTTTMPAMKDIIRAMDDAGVRDQVKIMVGGAPITQNYADEIGADGYSSDAADAVRKAKDLLNIN